MPSYPTTMNPADSSKHTLSSLVGTMRTPADPSNTPDTVVEVPALRAALDR